MAITCAALLIALLLFPTKAAVWQPRTSDWSTNFAPVIGDWGFDRPGYPKGLAFSHTSSNRAVR